MPRLPFPALTFATLISGSPHAADLPWQRLQPGVEYAVHALEPDPKLAGDGRLHVVRIDPAAAPLRAAMMSAATDGKPRTAAQWCRDSGLAVAINLGMYLTDMRSNVGRAHVPGHVNQARWNDAYKSVLAFSPLRPGLPAAAMVNLDLPGSKETLSGYGAAVQNLRLIKPPGRNVWTRQEKRWSEAAVAVDTAGRVLFLFTRYPHSMYELNEKLLALPLAIASAMHVEGGPEASLSIHAGGVDLDFNGSYETGFNEGDGEAGQWPIPNVLGVASAGPSPARKRQPTGPAKAPAAP